MPIFVLRFIQGFLKCIKKHFRHFAESALTYLIHQFKTSSFTEPTKNSANILNLKTLT